MTRPSADDIPFAELFPILLYLYVLLLTLTTVADGLYEGMGRPRPVALPVLEQLAGATQRWRALYPIAAYVVLALAVTGLGWLVRLAASPP